MKFVTFVSVLFVAVYGQNRDPTKVCFPDVFQMNGFSLINDVSGVTAFNYTQQVAATFGGNGTRTLFDLAANTIALINDVDKTCSIHSFPASSATSLSQCLPANAKLSSTDIYLGLKPDSLDIEDWEFDVDAFHTLRIAVTRTTPAVQVIRHIILKPANTIDVEVFTNVKTSVDDPTIFTTPDFCTVSPSAA